MDAPSPAPAQKRRPLRSLLGLLLSVAAVLAVVQGLQAFSERQLAAEVQARARPGDIRMISSETCVFCAQARAWLGARGVPFEECFVERAAACMAQYRALGARGTPTLLVRGRVQLGFEPARVAAALASGG